ncbi:phosphoadenylyl-sulfate reductase [Pseudorhodobacter aquimaris]|uniref:phosphoadenylyl-sulfate reductase n=1 Tax=Pseudorhodobacter aquimaris TaxID=687412 RepID=UPI00067BE68C|nr:phosphoadenylyl-sulfate reductase [Pseudorhodobacter aquimaris]
MLQSSNLLERATRLNTHFAEAQAISLLEAALHDGQFGKTALVSSFGAEAAVLLHMVSEIDRNTPVLFIDTEMLFAETLQYQRELGDLLGLRDLRVLRADEMELAAEDPDGTLHKTMPDACCALRKAAPLAKGLEEFDAWISGRKRYQGGKREQLSLLEAEEGTGRIKLNPLANWSHSETAAYIAAHRLPPHPLVAKGYGSIGCAPCTVPAKGREGRWQGQNKTECGIHFGAGKVVRSGAGG